MQEHEWVAKAIDDFVAESSGNHIQNGIEHLRGRKLYRYYSFSSEYTIPNLSDGLIYLQNPVLFNDPFDCNIGLSVNQLISCTAPELFDEVFFDINPVARDMLRCWFLNCSFPEIDETSFETLLLACESSSTFMNFLHKAENKENISNQEMMEFLMQEPDIFSRIIEAYLVFFGKGNFSFDDAVSQGIIQAPQVMRSLILQFGEAKEEKTREALEILAMKGDVFEKIEAMSNFMGKNIPRSETIKAYARLDESIRKTRKMFGERVGIECFTQSPTDVLMWSYYANKHEGICVEYDFSKAFDPPPHSLLLPVCYSQNRPLVNLETMIDPTTQQTNPEWFPSVFPSIIRSWITKSEEWEREKEWRLIVFPIENDSCRSIKLPIMSRIIAGINISEENYEIAADIARQNGVPLHRTRLKNDRYEIEIID